MGSRPILMALGVLVAGLAFADAYTWTDEDGVVHYSDRPQPGARTIHLPEQPEARPLPTVSPTLPTRARPEATSQPTFEYESLEISAPAAEETLWNIGAVLNVTLAVQPALQPGHQVRVYYDGSPQIVNGTSFVIQEVWRGEHTLRAEILNERGAVMIRSQTSRFYVQQATVR